MVRLHLLSCLLLLPLAACFPLLDGEAPMDTTGGIPLLDGEALMDTTGGIPLLDGEALMDTMGGIPLLDGEALMDTTGGIPLLDGEAPMDTTGGIPLLDGEALMDTTGGTGGGMSWDDLVRGHAADFPRWLRAPHPQALLVMAKELQMSGQARAGLGIRFRRQDDGRGEASSLLADGEKASSPLGTLANEFSGHGKKKGSFHFRFGRR